MKYLKLIRYQNLLLLAFMQLVFCYGFLKLQKIDLSLANWQYILLVLSTVCIAAGGYIINNIMDQDSDLENKPSDVVVGNTISETISYNLYVGFTLTGVGIGYYLSTVIMRPGFVVIFILAAALLYIYAVSLKQIMILGNVVIASLLSLSILIIGVYMIFPATYEGNQKEMKVVFSILIDYAIMAFIINLLREMVKDLEDIKGDYNQGLRTLPIVFGVKRTAKLIFGLSFIPLGILLYYTNEYFIANNLYLTAIYTLVFIVGPLLYFCIKMWSAQKQKEFNHLSTILKVIIIFGILSLLVISYNIKHHA